MSTIAVFPGTFDPITNGHLDIIKRASKIFDEVIVAVAAAPGKHPLFNLDTRCQLAIDSVKALKNVRIEGFSGMLVDFLKEKQANILIRGVRSVIDYDYEAQLSGMYRALMPELEIVMLFTHPEVSFISSTFVRDVIIHKGEIDKFVPKETIAKIKATY